jgi:Carboxymuconolactone decarboxylase family
VDGAPACFAKKDVVTAALIQERARWSVTVLRVSIWTLHGSQPSHELREHLLGVLDNGLTPEQLVEVFFHTAPYAGVPAAVDAMPIERQRKAGGIASNLASMLVPELKPQVLPGLQLCWFSVLRSAIKNSAT